MRRIKSKILCKELGISESIISRLKGIKALSNTLKSNYSSVINNKLSPAYLSAESSELSLEDLKKFIIYTILKEKNIPSSIEKISKLLEENTVDELLRKVIYEKKRELNLNLDTIINNLNIPTCIEILRKLYKKIEIEGEYKNKDILNIEENLFIKEENNKDIQIEKSLINIEENKDSYNILEKIFEKYSQYSNGYFPLQHPTGNGKTYYLINFLVKMLESDFKELDKERIIVITNNKVNVNEIHREIIKKLKALNQEEKGENIFKVKSLRDILSNVEFLEEILKELNDQLEFYNLFPKNFIINFKSRLKEVINILNKGVEISIDEYLQEYLLKFRNKMFQFYQGKLEENIVLPKFFYKLYPMIKDENITKKLFIMTTDKFLYGYTGKLQVEYFYENYKNSLIFIDEIDSAKEKFLKFTREQRTLTIKNITNIFNSRYNSFSLRENNQLINLIKRVSKLAEDKQGDKKDINLKKYEIIKKIAQFEQKGKRLRRKYFIAKRYFELENNQRIDLFEDNNHFIMRGNKKLYIEVTEKNCLITEKETPLELTAMLKELFNYTYGDFYNLIHNLYEFHINLEEDNDIEKEIISHLFYDNKTQQEILNEYKNFYIPLLKMRGGLDFSFSNSCNYVQIYEENPEYRANKKVVIGYQHMYITPEELFYIMCSKNFVFGISATAEMKTCVGNFDIKWLKEKLQNKYFKLNEMEKSELERIISKINNFEKNITRKLNVFKNEGLYGNDGFENLNNFLKKNTLLQKKIVNIWRSYTEKLLADSTREYEENYFNYATSVILNFLLEKKTSSLLFIGNRLTYKNILKDMSLEMGKYLKKTIFFQSLSAKDLDDRLSNLENDLIVNLENHKVKTIIFTTYQSAGVGVNIKHKYNKNLNTKLIKIDKEIQMEIKFLLLYKDIDEIALEHKTNLINFDNFNNDKITILYYCNLLLKNGAIDDIQRLLLLNRENDFISKQLYMKTKDYTENAAGKLIQGIGRCNRTKVRNKIRNIYLNSEAFRVIEGFEPEDRIFIEDFNFLLKNSLNKLEKEKDETDKRKNEIIYQNEKIKKYFELTFLSKIAEYNKSMKNLKIGIKRELKEKEFLEFYQKYQEYRLYILKNPTINNSKINHAYFKSEKELNSYSVYIEQENEIKDIYFTNSQGNISKEDCRLDKIKEIPLLKKFCKNNIGNFKKNKEILLPYSYQAIFKGILGECVIKELFSFFGIELKSFKEMVNRGIVEVFDDISINDMYIDYKNYNLDKINHREFLNDSIKEKLEYKRSLINKENKLFIINLIDKKISGTNPTIYYYKIDKVLDGSLDTCYYEESEVVIVTGILKYQENNEDLEINEIVLKKLKMMLGGLDE